MYKKRRLAVMIGMLAGSTSVFAQTDMTSIESRLAALEQRDEFIARHLGPSPADVTEMLAAIDAPSLAALINDAIAG